MLFLDVPPSHGVSVHDRCLSRCKLQYRDGPATELIERITCTGIEGLSEHQIQSVTFQVCVLPEALLQDR